MPKRVGNPGIHCLQCGKFKRLRLSHVEGSKFCSRQCRSDYGSVVKTCPVCKVEFRTKKAYGDAPRHCSIECRNQTMRSGQQKVPCLSCGKSVGVSASVIKRRRPVYCNPSCASQHKSEKSPAIYYRCERCGKKCKAYESQRFCSVACRIAANHRENSCRFCKQPFKVKPSHVHLEFYCSKECMAKDYSVRLKGAANPNHRHEQSEQLLVCGKCGKFFIVPTYQVVAKKQKFCSKDCATKGRVIQSGRNVRSKAGRRSDIGNQYFRSAWEANYARYLNWLKARGEIKNWEYEPETFEFHKIKRGSRFYLPDFRVTNKNDSQEYHEVKGWMDQKSKTKLARMAKYYPKVPLILIDTTQYRSLARQVSAMIPNWE